VMQMIVTLLIVGLPISLALSWVFDLTDAGIQRTDVGEIEDSLTISNKFILAAAGGLFVVVAVAIMFYLSLPPDYRTDDRSIAVLPFEDISPGGDQAYFGNGIADELRLELQGLDGLRVAGRTSSVASAEQDSKTIGETLNVDSILEGSIRKQGDSVRIIVQLTHVEDGFTIWSESYNREMEDIFEIQEEIAASVAGVLGVRLGVGGVNAFRGAGTQNVEAYEAYLRGFSEATGVKEATRLLKRAIKLDPNYATAWSCLGALTFHGLWEASPDQISGILDRAHQFVLRAVQLNPELATANSMLAVIRHGQFDWAGAPRFGLARERSSRAISRSKRDF
jgi:TolB-like protein